jgi:hypothetical protein
MKLKNIFLTLLITFILISCAKPNESVGTKGILAIEKEFITGGYARDFAVSDEILFIAEDQQGFSIYNHITGTQLCHRDTLDGSYLESTRKIVGSIYKDLIFVFNHIRLNVFDISNIHNPVFEIPLSGGATNIQKLKLLDNPDGGVDVFWTSNGDSKVFKAGNYLNESWTNFISEEFPSDVSGFDFNDIIIGIAAQQYGIHILDRTSGNLSTTIETTGEALDVKIVDNYVIAAIREGGFTIYDISDPTSPVHIFTENTSELIYTVDAEDDYLVLSSHSGGVILYDISEIAEPKLIDSIDDSEIGYTFKAEIKNGQIFASTRAGVYIISINE